MPYGIWSIEDMMIERNEAAISMRVLTRGAMIACTFVLFAACSIVTTLLRPDGEVPPFSMSIIICS